MKIPNTTRISVKILDQNTENFKLNFTVKLNQNNYNVNVVVEDTEKNLKEVNNVYLVEVVQLEIEVQKIIQKRLGGLVEVVHVEDSLFSL